MDTITHGITGALIGKAFFAERLRPAPNVEAALSREAWRDKPAATQSAAQLSEAGGVATHQAVQGVVLFATTVGAVFPDTDVLGALFSSSDLATLELHRGFTHSLVCLPLFAAGLATLTRWYARRSGRACPSWAALAALYAIGLASHILLDVITSFGTMIWSPVSNARVAWDLTVIVDFVFTGIVLLPQVTAWVYRERHGSVSRALLACGIFSLCALGVERLMRAVGLPFTPWSVIVAILMFAVCFFLPAWRGSGFRVSRAGWCRAGVAALAGYLILCAVAHYMALGRVEEFAAAQGLRVERLGALPMPPSLLHWAGLIRTPEGVYQAWLGLLDGQEFAKANFRFLADAKPNGYTEAVKQLPKVKTYLWFARFPVVRYVQQGDLNIVEFTDLRFSTRGLRRRRAFTFRVILDSAGEVIEQGWVKD